MCVDNNVPGATCDPECGPPDNSAKVCPRDCPVREACPGNTDTHEETLFIEGKCVKISIDSTVTSLSLQGMCVNPDIDHSGIDWIDVSLDECCAKEPIPD